MAQVTAISYKSPDATLKSTDLDVLTNHSAPFVIGGDLNAKHTDWYNLRCNKSGRTLAQHVKLTNQYTVMASNSPTYYPYIPSHPQTF